MKLRKNQGGFIRKRNNNNTQFHRHKKCECVDKFLMEIAIKLLSFASTSKTYA